jgi:tetratricopeptide (TPR) repeat protein
MKGTSMTITDKNTHHAKRLFPRPLARFIGGSWCALALLASSAQAQQSAWTTAADSQYIVAARNYDRALLEKTAEFISRQAGTQGGSAKALFLLGMTYWRLELVAFCTDDDAALERWGVKAIDALNEAEKAKADPYLTASHKALAGQLLATLGMAKAMKYGPLANDELKKAQKAAPQGYFSLLVDAVNVSRAPVFAGGNLKKAATMLEKLSKDFPDSMDVKIHLAEAYARIGRRDEARTIITPIVKSNPSDLFAAKVAARVKE